MKKVILLFAMLASILSNNQAQTVTDYDGNIYNTVTIGSQTWMKENLNVTHYNNGDSLPGNLDPSTWAYAIIGSYCYYNNTPANSALYGKLYNWYAVVDSRNLCPTGWHTPSDAEWTILTDYLSNNGYGYQGSGTDIAKSMADTSGWMPYISAGYVGNDQASNNSSGFTAIPSGYRYINGTYSYLMANGYYWSSTVKYNATTIYIRYLAYDRNYISRGEYFKNYGFSVRCVMDSVTTPINENSSDMGITIYPNPTTNNLTINFEHNLNLDELSGPTIIQIYNILGECVLQNELKYYSNTIDVTNLSNGIYILHISNPDGALQCKFIKE